MIERKILYPLSKDHKFHIFHGCLVLNFSRYPQIFENYLEGLKVCPIFTMVSNFSREVPLFKIELDLSKKIGYLVNSSSK